MSLRTLCDVFFAVVERRHPRVMLCRGAEAWVPVSSETFSGGVGGVAAALRSWGIAKGERVAILSENRPEWMIVDFASLLLGAVTVPIYATLTAEQTAYILGDSGARVVFVSSEAQLKKMHSIREQTAVERIVLFDAPATKAFESSGAVQMDSLCSEGQSKIHPQLEADARAITPDDLATIIYTSGTT